MLQLHHGSDPLATTDIFGDKEQLLHHLTDARKDLASVRNDIETARAKLMRAINEVQECGHLYDVQLERKTTMLCKVGKLRSLLQKNGLCELFSIVSRIFLTVEKPFNLAMRRRTKTLKHSLWHVRMSFITSKQYLYINHPCMHI